MEVRLLGSADQNFIREQIKIAATAGRLSRYKGNVFEIYDKTKTFEQDISFIKAVISMGHESITEHDYLVFALKDVSPVLEQILIEQRFVSFTIKSRREVEFSSEGSYIPNFHTEDGEIHEENSSLRERYKSHIDNLFDDYKSFIEEGIPLEDARFVLPYCFPSNIIMGVDARAFRELIVDLTKGKNSNISEAKELGEMFYQIMLDRAPYLQNVIEKSSITNEDLVEKELSQFVENENDYKILEKPVLLNCSDNVDRDIFVSALMRIYKYEYGKALQIYYEVIVNNKELQEKLMKSILRDRKELSQVNFRFQIPISLASLTHLTRHRTQDLLIPDFVPMWNLLNYKVPHTISRSGYQDKFDDIFVKNEDLYQYYKSMGIRDEDLVYFYLSGNTVNVVTNMDGETLRHFSQLRCCTKAQWEIRAIANELKKLASEKSNYYSLVLGPTCETEGVCYEGKESCGRIKSLKP